MPPENTQRRPTSGGRPNRPQGRPGPSPSGRPPFARSGANNRPIRKPNHRGNFESFRGRVFRKDGAAPSSTPPSPTPFSRPLPPALPMQKEGKLRIAVLGGCEEVGRNCTLLEYGQDIILIDMGLQFPEEDMPGVDYIIPNMTYLKGKERNIRGVIITHGHYDHIGAIPHTIPEIGNPPIFALPMTAGIIKKRQTDFETAPLNIKTVGIDDTLQLGTFRVSFFHINHSIPDSVGIVIETPAGTVAHTGDWKFDFHPVGTRHADFQRIAELGRRGVTLLMGDSTSSDKEGHTPSEKEIGETLERIIEKAPGRIIVGTFASMISRVRQLLDIAERHGRKVALDGYAMKTNVEISKELGYIKVPMSIFIKPEQMDDYPDNKTILICTGAQGEQNAALHRIANDEHRSLRIHEGDTVIFSSSIIPGNEASVQRLKDTLYRKGAHVFNYQMMDVHAGGHAKKEDIKLMLALLKPKYYVPIEGNHFLLRENAKVAASMGWRKEDIFVLDNGQVVEVANGQAVATKEKIPTDYVFVDGLGVGDVSQVVLRDRQMLAEDGMVVIIVQVERKSGKLVGSPDIISRGFVFMRDQQELVDAIRTKVKTVAADRDPNSTADPDYIKNQIRNEVGSFVFNKTQRRPMILPVLIEV